MSAERQLRTGADAEDRLVRHARTVGHVEHWPQRYRNEGRWGRAVVKANYRVVDMQ